MLNRLRRKVSRASHAIAAGIAWTGVSPNAITAAGLFVSALAAFAFCFSTPLVGALLVLLSGLLDVVDGAVARVSGKVSKWGGVLDSVLDRYSDLLVLGAITLSGLCDPVAGLAALVGSVMVSYVRARGENEGVRMSGVGLMERAERMILVSATAMLGMLDVGILLLAFLTNLTVAQRLYHIWRSLSRRL